MSGPKKILVVRLGSLGDILHTIPAQQSILEHLPDAQIHWLVEPPYQNLLSRIAGIHRIWLADTKKWRRRLASLPQGVQLIQSLRRERFDLALDFQGLVKSALLARLSGADRVLGLGPKDSREAASSYFYKEIQTLEGGSHPHAIEISLGLAAALGVPPHTPNPRIPLQIPEEAFHYVDGQLQRLGLSSPVLINPGAGWVTKLWPAQNYGRLLVNIEQELKLPVVVTHGPGEESLVEKMQNAITPHPLHTFPTTLLQLAALCRRSRLMVAGDTGPLHLAVALGTPVTAILGPTAPWRNGPYNRNDQIIKRYLFCSNCYKRTCDKFICMEISVPKVFETVKQRLSL